MLLGDMYRFDKGVPENRAEAVNWFWKAAMQNVSSAKFALFWHKMPGAQRQLRRDEYGLPQLNGRLGARHGSRLLDTESDGRAG